MNFQDITYSYPQGAYLVLGIFGILIIMSLLYLFRKRFFNKRQILSNSTVQRSSFLFFLKSGAFCFAWFFAVLALMNPIGYGKEWGKNLEEKKRALHDVILMIDVSASMNVRDLPNQNSRFSYAKKLAGELVSSLEGQQVALFAFTSDLIPIVPLTNDYLFTMVSLEQLQINESGLTGTSLVNAFNELQQSDLGVKSTPKTIILLSDGGDTKFESLDSNELTAALNEFLKSIQKFSKEENCKLFVVGIGSLQGGAVPNLKYEGNAVVEVLHEKWLQAISAAGNGSYTSSNVDMAENIAYDLAQQINVTTVEETEKAASDENHVGTRHYYQIPLGIAIFALSLIFLLPDSLQRHVKTLSLLVLLFNSWTLVEASEVEEHRVLEANAFVEVGEYAKGYTIYQTLIQTPRPFWQKAILLYNSAQALMVGGDLETASNNLTIVPFNLGSPLDPLLYFRVAFSQVLIKGLIAEKSIETDPVKTLKELEVAWKTVPFVEQAYCELQKAKGFKECQTSYKVAQLKQWLFQKQALALDQYQEWLLKKQPLEKAIPLLIQSITYLSSQIDFFNKFEQKSEIYDVYLELEKEQFTTIVPLWETIAKGLKNRKSSSELENLLLEAKEKFNNGEEMIEQKDYAGGKKKFSEAIVALSELLKQLPPPPPSQQPQQPPSEPPIHSQQKSQKEEESVIRLLLQMNQMDRKPSKPITTPNKSAEKPW